MASVPRILVVDPKGTLGGLVRSGLMLLNRIYTLVEVVTMEEAVNEISRSSLHLIITAYRFPNDERTGVELSERAIREQAGTPIVIVPDWDDPEPDPVTMANKHFNFLNFPPGEHFIRALRVGLDGEDVVQAMEGQGQELDIGPIPNIDLDGARRHLHQTIIQEGAIAGMICDRLGRILIEDGPMGYIDKVLVATMLGPSFPQAIKVGPQIGGSGWSMRYFDGDRYDLFALALGYHHFVVFMYDGNNRQALGAMSRYRGKGLEELIGYIGADAWAYVEQVVVTQPGMTPSHKVTEEVVAVAKRKTTAISIEELFGGEAPPEPEPEPVEEQPFLEPVGEMDLDLLFSSDMGGGDLFGDDGMLGDNSLVDMGRGESVSFDEAQNMGLLGE